MPAEVFGPDHPFLRGEELLGLPELERIVGAFVRCGVRKLRITGGEPLLRPGVVEFVAHLRRFGLLDDIAMTTNGLLLPRHAADLAAAGLQRVTVSLDALDPGIFHFSKTLHHSMRVKIELDLLFHCYSKRIL